MKRLVLSLGLVAAAGLFAACGGVSAAPATDAPATSAPAGSGSTVVAKDLKFQQTSVSVPAGAAFDLVLDNQEAAPHNIAISADTGASVFKGEIVSNAKVTYSVPALAAGAYPFICEVHPEMKGTITAE
jgi:plastocyanin